MSDTIAGEPRIGRIVFDAQEIAERVRELGREIDRFYPADEKLLIVGLLKGAFMFMGDLVRAIDRSSLGVDFLVANLYGEGTDSEGEVELLYDPETEVSDRHVVLVEDIIDSGKTLNRAGDVLASRLPLSLEVCALLDKGLAPDLRYRPRWVGFEAPQDWLVGYGLDLGERFRHLPYIASISPEAE